MKLLMMVPAAMGICTWTMAAQPGAPARPLKPADRYAPSVPTTQPDSSRMPRSLTPWTGVDTKAVELVKGVYAQEDWIHHVRSFRIQVRHTARTTAEGTAFNNRLFREQNRPAVRNTDAELAFDDRRFRFSMHHVSAQEESWEVRTWDGKTYCRYNSSPRQNQEGYGLYATHLPDGWASGGTPAGPFASYLLWPRARRHFLWFDPRDTVEDFYTNTGRSMRHPATRLTSAISSEEWRRAARPEDFHVVGTQEYRGIRCYVLEQRPAYDHWRWYVGVDTGLLHGIMLGHARSANPLKSDSGDPRFLEIYATVGFPAKTEQELFMKQSNLTRLQRNRLLDNYHAELRRRGFETEVAMWNTIGLPDHEEWFLDYREVAPGRWWPMRTGGATYGLNPQDRLTAHQASDTQVQKIEIDADLPDELFTMKLKEGVRVVDHRYDPPVHYRYRPGMPDQDTLAAWRESEDYQTRRRAEAMIPQRKAALDALIGKPAPELPAGGWFNTRPPTWEDLRGQTVIVEFAPLCQQGDNQTLFSSEQGLVTALHDFRAKTGLSIISICPSRTWDSTLKDLIHLGDCQYPVCRDVAGLNESNEGATFERYRIACGPYAFVVGPDAQVAHHGLTAELPEVRAYCEKLDPLPPTARWTDGTRDESSESTTAPADVVQTREADTDPTEEELEEENASPGLTVGVQMRPWRAELSFAGDYPPAPEEP